MVINLITFTSLLHKQAPVHGSYEVVSAELEKHFAVSFIDYQDINELTSNDFSILFITIGGVERLVIQHFESLPCPVIMLADGMQDSLAVALEISSQLRGREMRNEISHGELPEIIRRIFVLHSNFMAQHSLLGMCIGAISTSSSWFIANDIDYLLAKRRWGAECTDVSLNRIYEYYNQITDDRVGEACAHLAGKAFACREASPEDTIKVMWLYHAIRRTVNKDRLSVLTLNCSRLMEQTGTTDCLVLSLLSDEGIVTGHEGDPQPVLAMLTAKILTGKPAFTINSSMTSVRINELILAHCIIGIAQTERFIIRNHLETESSIDAQGTLPTEDVTITKYGGECLDEYYLSTSTLTGNINYISMYHTQVCIKMNIPAEYFLRNSLGDHHIILHGNHEQAIDKFLQSNGCKRIE